MKRLLSTFSSVDPNEILKFKNLRWWAPGEGNDASQALRNMHSARVQAIKQTLLNSKRMSQYTINKPGGFSAIDIGCGGGLMTETLKTEFGASRVMGVDASSDSIEAARTHAKQNSIEIEYECGTAEDIVKKGQKFDLVCALEVVEHVSNPELFLRSCTELCDGVLIVSTINRNFFSYLMAIVAAEKVFKLVPNGTHNWSKFLKVEELEDTVVNNVRPGSTFHTEKVVGLVYNPIFGTWTHTNTSICADRCNYIYFASK